MTEFSVGDRVVFDGSGFQISPELVIGGFREPRANQIYTIRAVRTFGDTVGVLLKEIHNPAFMFKGYGRMEPAYSAAAFRPVVDNVIPFPRPIRSEAAHA